MSSRNVPSYQNYRFPGTDRSYSNKTNRPLTSQMFIFQFTANSCLVINIANMSTNMDLLSKGTQTIDRKNP